MRRHRTPSRARALARAQRRQHAQQAPPLRLIRRLRPQRRDGVSVEGPRARYGLPAEVGPLRDLVGECFRDGRGREDALLRGGVRERGAVVEERGEDF